MRARLAYVSLALIALLAYVLLGVAVSSPSPGPVDLALAPLAGSAVPLAELFTQSGRFTALVIWNVAVLLVGLYYRPWLQRAIFAVVVNVVAWKASDFAKDVFHRSRPDRFFGVHETSFSYSSGHATDAAAVFVLWAFFVARSTLPQPWRAALVAVLVLWALGVSWSRLALGAHYLTDVAGGWLLGAVVVFFGFALVPSVAAPLDLRAPRRARSR